MTEHIIDYRGWRHAVAIQNAAGRVVVLSQRGRILFCDLPDGCDIPSILKPAFAGAAP